ncbi:MAG: GIY-YIG nuclease family protein [Ignavibacteriales bacterium]|nr:GIY-YIG nuclease family protein [Ignavibacteriales bacterium]
MAFYIYVIVSAEGLRYIGQTTNVERRLLEHNAGLSHYTKQGTGWRIIYIEEYPTRSEAMKREKWLKSGVGREWLKANVAGWSPPRRSSSLGS